MQFCGYAVMQLCNYAIVQLFLAVTPLRRYPFLLCHENIRKRPLLYFRCIQVAFES